MPNNLGIYFGIKGIEVIYAKGKKVVSTFDIPQEKYTSVDLEEKVPQEVKIVALIKEVLRKQKIQAEEVSICLSGRDLIIRSFELPVHLPSDELASAVNFEAKKYLPFRIEEILFDFKTKKDYKEKKTLVIFFGIKKEVFGFYLSIIKELGLKLNNIEYSGFSFLRFARMLNLGKKGTFAFVNADVGDEISFVVIEDSFPLFSRDFYLEQETEERALLEKLKGEIQLSLDYYYHRKFPSKHIEKIFIFGSGFIKNIFNELIQEMEINLQFIDVSESIMRSNKYSLSSLKALGVTLRPVVRLPFEFDLLNVWEQTQKKKVEKKEFERIDLQELKPSLASIILSIFMILSVFGWHFYQRIPIKKQINSILLERKDIHPTLREKLEEELKNKKTDYNHRISQMIKIFNQYVYLTEQLNIIPEILPEGIWLTELNILQQETKRELFLKGKAFLKDYNKELETVNKFFAALKNNSVFKDKYKNIELLSIEHVELDKKEVTNFVINCRQ